ncbi:MAG: Inward rectifier potassium channel Irk [Bacteroidota bacterium]|nr:Inward rectifier potassium channel Irk [Bacteroidota bacterium]
MRIFKFHKINPKARSEINTGFGVNYSDYGGRFVNKNGNPNIKRKGIGYFERISWYHILLEMPRWKFFLTIVLFYLFINLLFSTVYYFLGPDEFGGTHTYSHFKQFAEAFFFSSQSFTIGGYGRVDAGNLLINGLCAFEAFLGLLSLAVVTGLLYGRFSRPKAYIRFSGNALLAPFRNGMAIMLRLAPFKNTTLTDAEAKLTLGIAIEENNKMINKFYQLPLEYHSVNSLTLSWTIVHPINETSPFYNFTEEDFKNVKGEILVFVKAFDDMFSNTVVTRTSYTLKELIIGAKFNPMYQRSEGENKTLLHLDKLNSFSLVDLNFSPEKN